MKDKLEKTVREIKSLPEAKFSLTGPPASPPIDLLGPKGREHIHKINKGVSERFRVLMEKHYGFNPENS